MIVVSATAASRGERRGVSGEAIGDAGGGEADDLGERDGVMLKPKGAECVLLPVLLWYVRCVVWCEADADVDVDAGEIGDESADEVGDCGIVSCNGGGIVLAVPLRMVITFLSCEWLWLVPVLCSVEETCWKVNIELWWIEGIKVLEERVGREWSELEVKVLEDGNEDREEEMEGGDIEVITSDMLRDGVRNNGKMKFPTRTENFGSSI